MMTTSMTCIEESVIMGTTEEFFNTSAEIATPNSGSIGQDLTEWVMPRMYYVITLTLLSLEASLALLSNSLLIVTIRYSPSLKTPPNSQLISICVNNLLLVLNMVLGLVSLNISSSVHPQTLKSLSILGDFQLFLTSTSWLQYWCIFSAIGFYRCTTLRRPSMSARTRKTIIYRSIWIGWLLSTVSGMVLTLAFRSSQSNINWNPFRQRLVYHVIQPITLYQGLILMLLLCIFIAGLGILIGSYYRIFRMLYVNRPLCQNRVYPLVHRASISSEENDLTMAVRPSYRPSSMAIPSRSPFTISGSTLTDNNVTVNFQKRNHSISIDVLALENPIHAHGYTTSSTLHPQQSNCPPTSHVSNSSSSFQAEFTDISPSGELERSKKSKTSCALRNQSMKRDRVSLGGATKNSLVMLLTYFLFSLPMVICSIPGVLATDSPGTLALPLLFMRLVFFINSPAYPVWYLIFSRRVKKCLHRLLKHTKIKFGFSA